MKNPSIEHNFYKQIQGDIDRIDGKADKYRLIYYFPRILLIFLATIITISSGWKSGPETINFLNLLLVLGAISTATTAIDTLFQVETKKNIYRLMLVELREIRSELVFLHESNEADVDTVIKEKLFPKYQSIMAYSISLVEKENESPNGRNQLKQPTANAADD